MRDIVTLKIKEQFIVREIARKGKIENLKYDYNLIGRYEKLIGKRYKSHALAYRAIKRVANQLVDDKVLKKERVSLNIVTYKSATKGCVNRYTIRRYWMSFHKKNIIRVKRGGPLVISSKNVH